MSGSSYQLIIIITACRQLTYLLFIIQAENTEEQVRSGGRNVVGIKRCTSLALSACIAVAFCACLRKERSDPSGDSAGNDTGETSDESTDASDNGIKWSESEHFYLYGHEIVFGQTTVQELYDIACYSEFYDWDDSYTQRIDYTLDDLVRVPICYVYPDENAAAARLGGAFIYIKRPEGSDRLFTLKEGIVYGVSFMTKYTSLWGDDLIFDIPLTMTPEQLLENSGHPFSSYENEIFVYHTYKKSISDHEFEFNKKGRLMSFTLLKLE